MALYTRITAKTIAAYGNQITVAFFVNDTCTNIVGGDPQVVIPKVKAVMKRMGEHK